MKLVKNIDRVLEAPILKFELTEEFFSLIKDDVKSALETNIDVGFSLAGAIYSGREVELKTNKDYLNQIGQEFMKYLGN